jgi:hypothetical protein
MSDGDVTSEGGRLIAAWLNCVDNHRRHQQAMWDAFKDVQQTEAALAKWLAPPDAKPGEKIGVWFGDSLIQVEVGGVQPPMPEGATVGEGPSQTRVTIRYRGKHFEKLRCA